MKFLFERSLKATLIIIVKKLCDFFTDFVENFSDAYII